MELKIGDYIRTEYGINKIARIDENKTKYLCLAKEKDDDDGIFIYINFKQEDIIKSSPNIIDLIECDDYVLTEDYDLFRKVGLTDEDELMLETYIEDNVVILVPITKILKICTKENFERVSYNL